MKFYIIIPAHNEADCIEKTLQSLVSQTLLPKKVLVVNDHSTDETSKIVEKFRKRLLKNCKNFRLERCKGV